MPSSRGASPSVRRRIISTADRLLAMLGLVRAGRSRREKARFRYGYGSLLNALGMYGGQPERVPTPERIDVVRAVRSIARFVGTKRLAPRVNSYPPYEPAPVTLLDTVRAVMADSSAAAARGIATEFEQSAEMVATYSTGLADLRIGLWNDAYRRFSTFGRKLALQFIPDEYLQAAFHVDRDEAIAAARQLVEGDGLDVAATLDASRWLRIAERLVMLREPELVEPALRFAERAGAEGLEGELAFVRSWLEIEGRVNTVPDGAISLGVVDYKLPSFAKSSSNLGDHVQTLASMGHIVRHANLDYSGGEGLAELAETLSARVKPERVVADSPAVRVNLVRVQRDGSDLQTIPPGTWMVTFGWYAHPRPNDTYGMPLNPNIRPIFISMHINKVAILTPEAIEYLKKYAPIGCRDWNTVHLLHAAGIPAFFSGCITTTVDTVFPGPVGPRGGGNLWVDVANAGSGAVWQQERPEVRTNPFVVNLQSAIDKLTEYRDRYDRVHTSRLHCYLPARSIGANVRFIARNEADPRFDGLIGIGDAEYEKIRHGILDKLESVMRLILGGASETEVYELWAEVCAEDVAFAQQVRDEATRVPVPQPIDIDRAVKSARESSTHYGRTERVSGAEVDIEISLDGNFKTQMLVMVQSVLDNTTRPVHFWILARDHTESDYARAARLFPRASFTWIRCDEIDYGDVQNMLAHTTIATMDRLLLPLLVDREKIVHVDLDAICLGDIAQLYDIDVTGVPLAARTRQDDHRGGFEIIRTEAKNMSAESAREYIVRTHAQHSFDFRPFNAGVMVLNLERMRDDDFCGRYMPYAGKFGLHDQGVLNAYVGPLRREFAAEWNCIARDEIIDDAKLIHWAGIVKPWGAAPVRGQRIWLDARDRVLARLEEDSLDGSTAESRVDR